MNKKILFTTSHPAPYWDIIYKQFSNKSNIVVYYNRSKDVDKAWKNQNNTVGKIVSTTTLLEKFQDVKECDFAVLGGWEQKSNILFMLMLLVLNKPFAFFSDVPDANNITVIKKNIKKIFFYFVPYLFVTGKTGEDHYREYYNISDKKFIIFPYGVNLPNLDDVNKDIHKRKENLMNRKIKIFVANRFLERKGYKTLYEALTKLKEKNQLTDFSITIAGKGEQYEKYKQLFSNLDNTIKLVGWIELEEYEELMQECDVYIHASYFEPYGIPVVDAMAHGKLVIASDGVMSALDNIIDNQNGYIYAKYDSERLFSIFKNIFYNKLLLIELGKEALSVHQSFHIDYNKLITNIIEDNK